MPETQIQCPTCGAEFLAPAERAQVFCVVCGQSITRTTAPAEPKPKTEYDRAVEAFRVARFPIVDKKTGQKGDRLIELWTLLFFHGKNSRSSWGLNTARKDIERFFEDKRWHESLTQAGPARTKLLIEQLLDSAVIYLTTCRDDSKYGSKLLGVVRMNAEEVARKTTDDICKSLISFLLHLGLPGESKALIHAAVMAYPRVFTTQREALADSMRDLLTNDERQKALQIVAEIAEYNRTTQY